MSEAPTINMADFDPQDLALEDIDVSQRSIWIHDKKMAFSSASGMKRPFTTVKILSTGPTGR